MKPTLIFLSLLLSFCLSAQHITHGPVVGGVSNSGARIYVKTGTQATEFTLELDKSASFPNPSSYIDSTRTDLFGSNIITLDGLDSNTEYFYRFQFNGDTDLRTGKFRTFPNNDSEEPLRIIVGSCNYESNPSLFQQIKDFQPHLFIHLGDWNWPPAQLGNDYCLDPQKRAQSFAQRYADQSMMEYVLPFMPVEYIYDDDYSYNDSEGWTYPSFEVTVNGPLATTELFTNAMPPGIREGAIEGYFDHFPAYAAVDTAEGIHHRFRMGNLELFMLDARNSRTPRHDAFIQDPVTGLWDFAPDSTNHTMLGAAQRQWLLDELEESDADWKIIGSSVIFNTYYAEILDVAMGLQSFAISLDGFDGSGATLASNISYNWAGYPADQQPLLDLYKSGAVKDLLLISGDSHSSALDDGENSGIPELNSSGLAAGNEGIINYYVDSISALFNFPPVEEALWNGGGNGVGNTNFNDSYGTIEVFGKDSLRYCAIDEFGQVFGCITLLHSSLNTSYSTIFSKPSDVFQLIYPNPSRNFLHVVFDEKVSFQKGEMLILTNASGKKVASFQLIDKKVVIPVGSFPEGQYWISVRYKGEMISKTVIFHDN